MSLRPDRFAARLRPPFSLRLACSEGEQVPYGAGVTGNRPPIEAEPSPRPDGRAAPGALADAELLTRTRDLVERQRALEAELLEHLAEIDARHLYAARAYSSMFVYCVRELGFSEDVTYNRIAAARLCRRYPQVLAALRAGLVHLAGLRLLAPHVTPTNVDEVLSEAVGRSKREIQEIAVRLAPRPDLPARIRKLPDPPLTPAELDRLAPGWDGLPLSPSSPSDPQAARPPQGGPAPSGRDSGAAARGAPGSQITPLSPGRYGVQFTADQALHDKLREAQDLLRHQLPDGDPAQIIDRALALLIADVKKKRFGVGVDKPRASSAPAPTGPQSRHIPVAIRRAVWERDGGQCAFVDDEGRRCTARGSLEFHHLDDFASHRTHEVHRIQLRCRTHNQYEAELTFGREFMDARRATGGVDGSPLAPARTEPGARAPLPEPDGGEREPD